MIKIELVKFEAQDVITASVIHEHTYKKVGQAYPVAYNKWEQQYECECGDKKVETGKYW